MWAWLKIVGKWIGKAAIAYGPEVVGAVIERRAKAKRDAAAMVVWLCLWPMVASAQVPTLPAWVTDVAAVAAQTHPQTCPGGSSLIPVLVPGRGISYECRPDLASDRDKLADRLTELNAALIIVDSTLTGYLVWGGIGEEANPLMKPIYDADRPWRVGIKGALGAAQMIGIYRVTKPRSRLRYTSLVIAIAINAYACVNNYRIYRDHRDTLR